MRIGQRVMYQDAKGADHDALVVAAQPNNRLDLVWVNDQGETQRAVEVPHYRDRLTVSDRVTTLQVTNRRTGIKQKVEQHDVAPRRQAGDDFWRQ